MIQIDRNNLVSNFCERQDIQKTRLNTAVYLKIRNDNYYFSTIPKQNNKFRDLVIYNPNTNKAYLWDLKKYLNALLIPAIINDNDLIEIKKYLTHLRGDYIILNKHINNVRFDEIIDRQIKEELAEKQRLLKHYKIVKGGAN